VKVLRGSLQIEYYTTQINCGPEVIRERNVVSKEF